MLLWLSLVINVLLCCSTKTESVFTSVLLVDARAQESSIPLKTGDAIDLSLLGTEFSVALETSKPIGSVLFDFNGDRQVKNEEPYIFNVHFPAQGLEDIKVHALSALAYSCANATGPPLAEEFSVVFSTTSANPRPKQRHLSDVPGYEASSKGTVNGILRKWHKISIGFLGPLTSESAAINPFVNYRLDVTFTHLKSKDSFTVPGYYAADGNAANTAADSGRVWLVHFAPNRAGTWEWTASFRTGTNIAATSAAGVSAKFFDGASGSFQVLNTIVSGRDNRGLGRLEYVGKHHLRFGEGTWFFQAGTDSPENFLSYEEFDNTPNLKLFRKSWSPHLQDYTAGDPTWANGKGKGIVGAVNYLSNIGMNSFSFLTFTLQGDDGSVYPFVSSEDLLRYDVSKLAQWEIVFEHADHMGMHLHVKTQERENDHILDSFQRTIYYRELIARFSHHLALTWNLGEENSNSNSERKQFADYFKETDPYQHPVVVHTWPTEKEAVYSPLLGYKNFDGASLQSTPEQVYNDTLEWRRNSDLSKHEWIVTNDEQNKAKVGVMPDRVDPDHDMIRSMVLWGNLMAGGAGVAYYFGYAYENNDLTCEDFRDREKMFIQTSNVLSFLNDYKIPFWDMDPFSQPDPWVLANSSSGTYVVYVNDASKWPFTVDLQSSLYNSFSVMWFNPRTGGKLLRGSRRYTTGGKNRDIGTPPDRSGDWVALIQGESR